MPYAVPSAAENPMQALKQKLDAFQRTKLGLFLKKFIDDQATNLAALLAWGTLSTLLPLILGILAITGLVLRDSQRVDQVYGTLVAVLPQDAAGPVSDALDGVRQEGAAPASIVGLVLLLFNGSSFFSNMASVFDQAFHVDDRNIVMKTLVSVMMLIITSVLLVVSIVSLSIGGLIDSIAQVVGIGPVLGRVVTWSISIVSTVLLFLLVYRILPNKRQSWGQALPGALLGTVLFFAILLVFPLYVKLFPPNHAYAVFGIFLVLTFWLYLLGMVFVLGAELNAFLQEPSRAVALAEATQQAQRGKASFNQATGEVQANSRGTAPALSGTEGSPSAQMARNDQPTNGTHAQRGNGIPEEHAAS
jgi:membrane protein